MEALDEERWRGGDIASLKPERLFSPDQYNALLAPRAGSTRGYLDAQACGHPVVIVLRLSKRSTHAMITPISSHGSGHTALALPWARRRNRHKDAEHFRAICDTPRPSTRREALLLESGRDPAHADRFADSMGIFGAAYHPELAASNAVQLAQLPEEPARVRARRGKAGS